MDHSTIWRIQCDLGLYSGISWRPPETHHGVIIPAQSAGSRRLRPVHALLRRQARGNLLEGRQHTPDNLHSHTPRTRERGTRGAKGSTRRRLRER